MGRLAEGGAVMPGLGILYIAALLREQGLPVMILDAEGRGLDLEQTIRLIVKEQPDILGITATTLSIVSAAEVARGVKYIIPEIKVFVGGPHVTAMPIETMEYWIDIDGCVIGDGEISFLKIVKNLQLNLEVGQEVDGLVWRKDKNSKIYTNPKKSHLNNLDILPFPSWDLLKGFPKIYRPPVHSYHRLPVANIITTRGCPFACSFCDRSVFGRKVYSHSVEYIIEMIKYLIKDFGIREISIKDDMFILSHDRVIEFCRQFRNENIDLTWSCNARVNSVNGELLREMKRAGCWMISYGIESGSPKMLTKMKKGITKEQIINTLKLTRKHGIVSKGFFMLGVPGETKDTLNETYNYIRKIPLDEINVNFFTPFPGSNLYHEVVDEGFEIDFNLNRMSMLEPVYVPKDLMAEDLTRCQKQIILSFYLNLSKIAYYILRTLKNFSELKRILRMGKVFFNITRSSLENKWLH
jgi:radical SAM superfamily enzyme YgiQ (UPF0313 family)